MRRILNIRNGHTDEDLDRVVGILAENGVIIYPTDTVYGFGCAAGNDDAILRISEIKHRDAQSQYLALIRDLDQMDEIAQRPPDRLLELLKKVWPAPLSIILKSRDGRSTIGVRMPNHPFCQELLKRFPKPIISTSVNDSGRPPMKGILQISEAFGDRVDLIVDAGDAITSVTSTLLDLSGQTVKLVREGAVPKEQLEDFWKG